MRCECKLACNARNFGNSHRCRCKFLLFLLLLSSLKWGGCCCRDGSAKTFLHRICISTFCQNSSHRIALFLRRICILHSHRTFRVFALFPTFWSIFHGQCTKKLWRCKNNAQKNAKKKKLRKCKECEKVRDANAMRKWNQNSHRTTVTIFFFAFSPFFASHYHPCVVVC